MEVLLLTTDPTSTTVLPAVHVLPVKPNLRRPGRREVPVTCGFVARGEVCSVDGGSVGVS
jgi:hypothetical protein